MCVLYRRHAANANRFEPGPTEKQTHQDPGQVLLDTHRWPLLRIYHLKYMFFCTYVRARVHAGIHV